LLDLCSKGVMKSGCEPKDVARIATGEHGPTSDLQSASLDVVESAREDRR
jgi:hypothetical protein